MSMSMYMYNNIETRETCFIGTGIQFIQYKLKHEHLVE